MGTADALQQCLEQHSDLLKQCFTVCNGNNLYNAQTLKFLVQPRRISHALIAYDGMALGHSEEKTGKFALLDFDKKNCWPIFLKSQMGKNVSSMGRGIKSFGPV